MRDQWRAEDHHIARFSGRAAEHRRGDPSASRRRDHSAEGLRIRGRAADETPPTLQHRKKADKEVSRASRREIRGDRSRSPRGERVNDSSRRPRDISNQQSKHRSRYQDKEESTRYRRRTHSGSPARHYFDYRDRDEHKRLASPLLSRTERTFRPRSRGRDRTHSPLISSVGDHYSSTGRLGDSYVPHSRRHSRSPQLRERWHETSSAYHRSKSRERHKRSRRASLTPPRYPSPRRLSHSPRKDKDTVSAYRPKPLSRHPLKGRKVSLSPPNTELHRLRRKESASPDRIKSKHKSLRNTNMQHSQAASPLRPIPSFDASTQQRGASVNEPYPLHGMKASDVHTIHRPMRPPRVDTRQSYSTSPQWTPTSSHHGSPHSASPYGHSRGGWGAQPQHYSYQPGVNAYSPPQRQNSYPPAPSPQAQYYTNGQQSPYTAHQQAQHGYSHPTPRGSHQGFRGNHFSHASDRRFSGLGSSPTQGPIPTRGRGGHFQNLQWTASSSGRGRSETQTAQGSTHAPSQQSQTFQDDESDNPFRPSKDLRVEDQTEKEAKTLTASPKEGSKIKFAFKTKAIPSATAKPIPDLTQRVKDASRKDNLFESKLSRDDRSDFRYSRENDSTYRSRDERYDRGVRHGREQWRDRDRERSPDFKIEKKVMKRKAPKRTLSPSVAESTSVYYRKPGNESVVGSGTYGKVFKAIHVYTKSLAALKKIRMDGEKDGFPVTAVREIKLLQSLKHDNVVSLQEVMVEHNDCFMVFEYLSHDLTGLLNHPTFKLENAHKKHLGWQLFEGLNHLHRRGVLHRDIKAANILVSNQGLLKLADFGLARFYSKRGRPDYTNRVITIWYRSPELLLGETQYGPAVDIWSAACVMVEIFTRHAIFPGDGGEINQLDKIYNILGTPTRSEWPDLVDMAWFELLRPTERRPNTFAEKYQERVTPAAFELLTTMFLYDPNKRPSAGDVLEHPYFTAEEPAPRQAFE